MIDYQSHLLRWASVQGEAVSLVLVALGMLYSFQGFRFGKMLMALSACVIGGMGAGIVVDILRVDPQTSASAMVVCALVAMVGSLTRYRFGLTINSIGTLTGGAYWLSQQLGLPESARSLVTLVGLVAGVGSLWIGLRTLPIALTTLHGGVLFLLGFVGFTSAVLPSMGATFVTWADAYGVLTPVMMTMLVVTGWAAQANAMQGDMQTGAGRSWNTIQV